MISISNNIKNITFSYINDVFTKSQWTAIDSIIQEIAGQPSLLEHVTKGVSRLKSVKFSLDLHRFIIRENGISKITGSPYSKRMLTIVNNSPLTEKISHLIKKEAKILRMQLNIMSIGDFVSEHTGQESDDDYLCSILIRTTSQYTGGDLTIYDTTQKPHRIRQPNHSILAMSSQRVHKVAPITSGFRYTICGFLG